MLSHRSDLNSVTGTRRCEAQGLLAAKGPLRKVPSNPPQGQYRWFAPFESVGSRCLSGRVRC